MQLEVLTAPAQLVRIRGEWERLAAADGTGGIFATAAWHLGWLRHIALDAVPAVATFRDPSGTLVAVAPLCHWPYHDLGFTVPALRFSGREVASGDYLDLVATPEARVEATGLLLDHLATSLREGKLLLLGEIVQGSATDHALAAWIAREGFSCHRQEERCCPHLPLHGSYEAYIASLSPKMRKHIRNKTRRIGEEPRLEIRRVTGPAAAAALPELFRLHALLWESRGEKGTFVRPGFKEFLAGFVAEPPPSVTPNLYLLLDRGQAIASLLIFHARGGAMHYQGGWDPASEHARHSPLLVLVARSIADAMDAALPSFDFLRGDEPYKFDFTSNFRMTSTWVVAGNGLRARGYFAALKMKERAKRLLRPGVAAAD